MAITINDGFSLGARLPIDSRFIVDLYSELSVLLAYEGLVTYVKEHQKEYIYKNDEWVEHTPDLSQFYKKIETYSQEEINTKLAARALLEHLHALKDISDIFVGTRAEYDTADAAGKIPLGCLVFITDDNVSSDASSPILGTGVLGSLVLA